MCLPYMYGTNQHTNPWYLCMAIPYGIKYEYGTKHSSHVTLLGKIIHLICVHTYYYHCYSCCTVYHENFETVKFCNFHKLFYNMKIFDNYLCASLTAKLFYLKLI